MISTDFLFAQPSFILGIARLTDLKRTLVEYNSVFSPEMADSIALRCDMRVIGQDLHFVLGKLEEEMNDAKS
jgi:hypothetical protein